MEQRAGAYLYRDGKWLDLPSQRDPAYSETTSRSGPDFDPTGLRIVVAATGKAEDADGIVVEKTQRSPSDTAWWWLSGNTYPHRQTLKQNGCRWSKKRRAWYFIGEALPDALQQLINEMNTTEDEELSDDEHEPCSVEEASAILGVPIRPRDAQNAVSNEAPIPSDNEVEFEEPKVRVVKPLLDTRESDVPDPVIVAVRQTKAENLPTVQTQHTTQGRQYLQRIPQAACGELTGSVWCYGYATYEGFVSM